MLRKLNSTDQSSPSAAAGISPRLQLRIEALYKPVLQLAEAPMAIIHEASGIITLSNRALGRLLRSEHTGLIDKNWSALFHSSVQELAIGKPQTAIARDEVAYKPTVERLELDGAVFLFVRLSELRSDALSETVKGDSLQLLNHYHQTIMDSTSNGVLLVDSSLQLLTANKVARRSSERHLGLLLEEELNIRDLLPDSYALGFEHYCQLALKGEYSEVDRELEFLQGKHSWLRFNFAPARNPAGDIFGVTIIIADITQQRITEERLHEQNKELQKANKELDKFVYSVSHDLRAPIANTIGLATIMKAEGIDGNFLTYVEMIESTMKRMDTFIYQILDYSRNNRLELKLESIEMRTMIKDLLDDLYFYNEQSKLIDFQIEVDPGLQIISDRQRLSIMLNNLLSNAIKYHDEKKQNPFIRIKAESKRDCIELSVADNGQGIKKEHLEHLFDMFYTANLRAEGSGIGLYILKDAVNHLNGRVTVESELGIGTEFKITLPKL